MFSKEHKEAYNSIKAPDELRDRIFSSVENEKVNKPVFKTQFSRIVAAAACIVFVVAAVFVSFSNGDISVSVNNASLEENSTVLVNSDNNGVALAREINYGEVKLTLYLDKEAYITVDSGSFDIVGEDENLTEFTAEGDVEIIWESDGYNKSTMTVDYGRKTCELILEYNGEWVVTRK